MYSFKKKAMGVEDRSKCVEKAQIIQKSIGEKKMSNFSKYSNAEMGEFSEGNNKFRNGAEQSSYQMGKMKSLLRIIDDYRQNAVENDQD